MRMSLPRYLMLGAVASSLMVLSGCMTTEVKSEGAEKSADKPAATAKQGASDVATGYQPIQSELIYSVTFDQANSVMTMVLYEEGVFDYKDVPRSVYDAFLKAKDRDEFYRTKIQPTYKGEKFKME